MDLRRGCCDKRKEYDFLVKLLHVDGFAGAGRRNGKIVRTQEPEQYPLSRALPATVEIEFSDNHGNTPQATECSVARSRDARSSPNGCMMIITKGARQGWSESIRKNDRKDGETQSRK